jgi:hypothetical protein
MQLHNQLPKLSPLEALRIAPLQEAAGNGLLLFFKVDDFDVPLPRARVLVSQAMEASESSRCRFPPQRPTVGFGSSPLII